MTDTTSAAPSDAEIDALDDQFRWDTAEGRRACARAVLARWGAPQPVVLKLEEIYSIYLKSGLGKFHLSDGVMECEYERCIYDFARGIEKAIRGIGTEKGDSNE